MTISPTEILIFGGQSKNGGWQKKSYTFNVVFNTIEESAEIQKHPGLLLPSAPLRIGDQFYAQQRYNENKVVMFEMKSLSWHDSVGMDIGIDDSNLKNYVGSDYVSTIYQNQTKFFD